MELKQLIADDDAVSPVIGVILMVAITVILAAVIGTFVLGIGQDQQTTPSATFDFENNGSGGVDIVHSGGDTFTNENTGSLTYGEEGTVGGTWSIPSGGVGAGDSPGSGNDVAGVSGQTVVIIWEAPGGSKTQTVGSFEVPA